MPTTPDALIEVGRFTWPLVRDHVIFQPAGVSYLHQEFSNARFEDLRTTLPSHAVSGFLD
jgi:transposase